MGLPPRTIMFHCVLSFYRNDKVNWKFSSFDVVFKSRLGQEEHKYFCEFSTSDHKAYIIRCRNIVLLARSILEKNKYSV